MNNERKLSQTYAKYQAHPIKHNGYDKSQSPSQTLDKSVPSPDMIKTDADDDEMDFRDPSWDHLQLIYELTFRRDQHAHLIHLFSSADDREPQYVKIIVHAIYGRFMALRKSIRKHLSDYCYKYVYESKLRDSTSWQGLPEILEIFCSIFQGLNVSVKPDYHIVLRNVIVPLHKSFHLDEFHEQLLQCCTQFVTKDPYSAPVILGDNCACLRGSERCQSHSGPNPRICDRCV